VTTLTNHSPPPISELEQQVYKHLLFYAQLEPASQVLDRFRQLFLSSAGYPDREINSILEKITLSKHSERDFPLFLNRCCYILINRWQMSPQTQGVIPELVAMLAHPPSGGNFHSRRSRRLLQLLKLFTETEQFQKLQRTAQVIGQPPDYTSKNNNKVKNLIRHYPYLYQHYLINEDSGHEQQEAIRQIQSQMQRRFELDLSQYVTYQVRLAQLADRGALTSKNDRLIQPVNNPTLLSDRDLAVALKHFIGNVEGSYSYRDLAHRFTLHTNQVSSYKVFKDDFYQYLISSINSNYGKKQFNHRLYNHLKNILPDNDFQKPDEFMIIRTCTQLLNYLIVESHQKLDHYVFVDLITNLGPTFTTGLLLKIVLLCNKVKPQLEKRFTVLFNHYESFDEDGVPWLIASLENLNVAFSTHFGKADVSCLKQLM
jgi:hypothetical protein